MNAESYNAVYDLLTTHRSMPFLKVCALLDLESPEVREIVDVLESKQLVNITNKNDSFKEIITVVRQAAFAAGRSFGD